jgi:hypothetical protein
MDEMPRDVETAVRAAARAAGGYTGALDDVYRRARRRRSRQAAAGFGAVAALLTVVGVGVASQRAPSTPAPVPPAAVSAPAPEPAQRLLLTGATGSYRTAGSPALKLGNGDPVGELRPDGRLVGHDVVGADSWDRSIGLPDGRTVALGPVDTAPGADRKDGVDVAGLKINLVVAGADGAVQLQRDVRRKGESVALLTASGTTAYLWRPAGLITHDLVSGAERVLVSRKALGVTDVFDGSVEAADLVGERLVVSRSSDPCEPAILDTRTGAAVTTLRFSDLDCKWVTGLRLSPDGATAAVVYQTSDVDSGFRIAVARIAGAAVLTDREVPATARKPTAKQDQQVLTDVAWQDDRTLSVVAVPIGAGILELKPFTITVN